MPDSPPTLAEASEAIGTDRSAEQRQRHLDNLAVLMGNMARYGHQRDAPVRTTPAYLGDRWSSLVMHLLSGGMLRFTELRRLMSLVSAEQDISQRVLTLKLRVLERDGLLDRHVTDDVPPRVEYRLTNLGQQAYVHFAAMVRWSEQVTPLIHAARADYDHRHPDAAALVQAASGPTGAID
jgi:DNA-binding HxlR family transcriptional regulator